MARSPVSVPDQTPHVAFAASATPATEFPFSFPYWQASDLVVRTRPVGSEWTIRLDYDVVPDSGESSTGFPSGKVVFTAPVANVEVLVRREKTFERISQFPAGVALDLPSLNRDVNRSVGLLQTLRMDIARAFKLPVDTALPGGGTEFPEGDRAGRVWGFDGDGDIELRTVAENDARSLALQAELNERSLALQTQVDGIRDLVGVEATAIIERVPTIAAMLAITAPTNGMSVEVTEEGRSGLFVFDTSLTAAANGGTTFKAADATVGSWARRYSGPINVRWFGAKGDGITDDTAAVHACFDFAKSLRGQAYFPSGRYRVTSGYTQDISYADLMIVGDGSTREINVGMSVQGSMIELDSTDPSSFFYRQTARHHLQVRDINFRCNQYVMDREFFAFAGPGSGHTFDNVNFESVEKPINYIWPNCYFQSSELKNVQFRGSGTIHSKVGAGSGTELLNGTLLILTDVHHESVTPINSDKILCDLSGIRQVRATNLLLEGTLPESGWTVLRIHNAFNFNWVRSQDFTVNGFWSEWGGTNQPFYVIHQTRGLSQFNGAGSGVISINPLKDNVRLEDGAHMVLTGLIDTSSSSDPGAGDSFELDGNFTRLTIRDSQSRNWGTLLYDPRVTLENCELVRDGGSPAIAGSFNNNRSELLIGFDGGFPDTSKGVFGTSANTISRTPSVVPTYGRAYLVEPQATALNFPVYANVVDSQPGQIYSAVLWFKLPVFTTGLLQLRYRRNNLQPAVIRTYDPIYSGSIQRITATMVDLEGGANTIGVQLGSFNATDISGLLEVYRVEIWLGKSVPQHSGPLLQGNVVTFNNSAPTIGEWKQGDQVWRRNPSAGVSPGWLCTVSGTPGTWKAMASLEA